ncbi:MAG: septal ring lytic transglycosylase RlpA family protein [Acidimicrobiales bacterium]
MEFLTQSVGGRRRFGAVMALCVAMLVVPLLCLRRAPTIGRADALSVSSGSVDTELVSRLSAPRPDIELDWSTGTGAPTDAVPADSVPPTSVAPAAPPSVPSHPDEPPTSVVHHVALSHVSPSTVPPAPHRHPPSRTVSIETRSDHSQAGQASWYDTASGTCASRSAPYGTLMHVTNTATGATTTCRVADYGPTVSGRIIDLSRSSFSQIADTSQGVITVRVEW